MAGRYGGLHHQHQQQQQPSRYDPAGSEGGAGPEATLWTKYHEIRAVFNVRTCPENRVLPLYDDSGRYVDMNEVWPRVFVGGEGAARNTFYLKKVGVTHVLNTAEGSRMGTVDTNQNYYKPFGIKYKGLKLLDVAQTNISMYFNEVADFIDDAVRSGGQVLVNCLMGMSRSSTCVIAYLMLKQNMTAVQALTEVRRHRDVRPNDGFLRQLADLDNKLRRERGQLMG
ncbi:dual specificity protein phosphatase 3-like isoform X3 [Tigriopus californicus]|uniref:dual specificity protein phosphatase 3-like isoform X3 n=1 Tax=Tigriopus californicus TaxID=6832 RepID=UPI0027DA290C|nr:dual specificity protein phosphatase 3-like isoform X3 [Tigriopus californicus]XP_059078380.1 dual specificity protein phosphatase 3-like isoform X3 [Tigriopus californicus]XP_059078381.1 dual specificity protein phosphatase 3-like isoform X3 [Tigriopus californicus]XP_059078382.1 dual specificity protein phosphatase 3-like isoform X3 [Tigriopus californicus]XP_059078383.1 dual specificity protein phosphatase 3-like isoform X3 [Tigriopus californicus]